jgi:hypothetical protein
MTPWCGTPRRDQPPIQTSRSKQIAYQLIWRSKSCGWARRSCRALIATTAAKRGRSHALARNPISPRTEVTDGGRTSSALRAVSSNARTNMPISDGSSPIPTGVVATQRSSRHWLTITDRRSGCQETRSRRDGSRGSLTSTADFGAAMDRSMNLVPPPVYWIGRMHPKPANLDGGVDIGLPESHLSLFRSESESATASQLARRSHVRKLDVPSATKSVGRGLPSTSPATSGDR